MKWIRRLNSGQRGFTLLELLVAIPIAGIVVAAATAGLMSVANSKDASTHMYSLRQVQTAGYWVSTDGYQAHPQFLEIGSEGDDYMLKLQWTDISAQEVHKVTYKLEGMAGGPRTLVRFAVITDDTGDNPDVVTELTVARYLLDSTGVTKTANGFTFTVAAQVGREPVEERTYNVTLRPEILSDVRY